MSKGTLHSASEGLSVVDDVEDAPACSSQVARDAHDDPEVIDLGGGYIEINGNVFYEDWDKIDPPGCEDEEEIPHEEVMAYLRELERQNRERRGRP